MSWNRPNENAAGRRAGADATRASRRWVMGVAGALAAGLAVVAVFLLLGEGERPGDSSRQRGGGYIKAVKPAVVRRAESSGAAATGTAEGKAGALRGAPSAEPAVEDGGTRHAARSNRVVRVGAHRNYPKPLFSAISDCQIEDLVNYQPGVKYISHLTPAELAKDFMAHITDKVEISPDDPPEVAERKRRYAEVRKGIIQDIRNGASLEEMIAEARETLDKVERMRTNFINALNESQDNGATDDELDDLATAATQLLKEHGANPILSPRQQIEAYEESLRESLNKRSVRD